MAVVEIKNKALRKALEAEGLADIHLYRNDGYFYIQSDDDKKVFTEDSFYGIYRFNRVSIEEWVKLIKNAHNPDNLTILGGKMQEVETKLVKE